MAGQLTVVTGGSRGIGAAICRRLAAEGHDVVITYLRDSDAADEVASDVRRIGQRALVLQTDTTDGTLRRRALPDQAQTFGTLTGLVNNAGSASAVGPLEDNSLQAISQDLNVNLLGVIACTKYAIGPMSQAGGGSIVNISSAAATLGGAGTCLSTTPRRKPRRSTHGRPFQGARRQEHPGERCRPRDVVDRLSSGPRPSGEDRTNNPDGPCRTTARNRGSRRLAALRRRKLRHRRNDPHSRRALNTGPFASLLRNGPFGA